MVERLVNNENFNTCNIDSWVNDCGIVWEWDQQRTVFDLYYHVVMHASKLGEALRRELYDDAVEHLGRTVIWLLSFVGKLKTSTSGFDNIFFIEKDLAQILWNKYPNCCPVCYGNINVIPLQNGETAVNWKGELVPCTCLQKLADVEGRNIKLTEDTKERISLEVSAYSKENIPKDKNRFSLDWFQKMYGDIFSANLYVTDIEDIGFHLLEEVGEIAEALRGLYTFKTKDEVTAENRLLKLRELENEIADTFSWIFTLSNKLIEILKLTDRIWEIVAPGVESSEFSDQFVLSQILWRAYGNPKKILGCRDCKKIVCECDIYLLDEKLFSELLPDLHQRK